MGEPIILWKESSGKCNRKINSGSFLCVYVRFIEWYVFISSPTIHISKAVSIKWGLLRSFPHSIPLGMENWENAGLFFSDVTKEVLNQEVWVPCAFGLPCTRVARPYLADCWQGAPGYPSGSLCECHDDFTQKWCYCIADIRGQHSDFWAKVCGIFALNIIVSPNTRVPSPMASLK